MQQTIAGTTRPRPIIADRLGPLRGDVRAPAFQAFLLLWAAFTAAPIPFGIDKFFNWMTFWPNYLGATHRKLSAFLNALPDAGLEAERFIEPPPPVPAHLLWRCRRR